MKDSVIHKKSYAFALRIIRLYSFLIDQKEYILSKQLLRSWTAIGAMVREAEFWQSRADFVHKLSIALKEANETEYLDIPLIWFLTPPKRCIWEHSYWCGRAHKNARIQSQNHKKYLISHRFSFLSFIFYLTLCPTIDQASETSIYSIVISISPSW